MIRTRFAPSPTGDLHLGGAWTALASWVLARARGGRVLLRVEDLDPPRVVAGAAARIAEDLAWLGLDWDEGPVFQSGRAAAYDAAIATLSARGLVYPCDCSRQEIARVASAPHAGEESIYPGICRDLDPARPFKRSPALRVRVPDREVSFDDSWTGTFRQHLARDVGDFVLRRGDGVTAYQLAVAVDDAQMGVTDVVRGVDLLGSTPRQIWLLEVLGLPSPRYAHVPLVVAADGARLAKRTRGASVRELRAAGFSAEEIVGELAFGLGLAPDASPRTAREVAEIAAHGATRPVSRDPWPLPARFARACGAA